MAKSQLQIARKKDFFIFRWMRPVELIVTWTLIVALVAVFGLIVYYALDILDQLKVITSINDGSTDPTAAVNSFKSAYNALKVIEQNLKKVIDLLLTTTFALILAIFVVRACTNGGLLLVEMHDYKHTRAKGFLLFNIIKRTALIVTIVIVISLFSVCKGLISDYIHTPISTMLNGVETGFNQLTDLINGIPNGLEGVTEEWLSKQADAINEIFNGLKTSIEAPMDTLMGIIDPNGPFIKKFINKGICFGIFCGLWLVEVIVLCTISKIRAGHISIKEKEDK